MNILQQLVTDEIDRRRDNVDDADARLNDAKARLDEAKANALKVHAEFDELKAWLVASKATP